MPIPTRERIGCDCDISLEHKRSNILEAARNGGWERRISVEREISSSPPLIDVGPAGESAFRIATGASKTGKADAIYVGPVSDGPDAGAGATLKSVLTFPKLAPATF